MCVCATTIKLNNMNKLEEKFKQEIVYCKQDFLSIEATSKKCVELTEQECIGFAEWIDEKGYYKMSNGFWREFAMADTDINGNDLFQLYLKSKENERI